MRYYSFLFSIGILSSIFYYLPFHSNIAHQTDGCSHHATESHLQATNHFCGFDHLQPNLSKEEDELQEKLEAELYQLIQKGYPSTNGKALYTIPVVVHVIHDNGVGNIPNTQVTDAIQHLNDAFANLGVFNPLTGVDVEIQFCLAQRDPAGNATNGITNTNSPLANITTNQDSQLKNLVRWNPFSYVNIYVVSDISGGVAGYAYLPSAHGNGLDGIVLEDDYMGTSTDNSKVLVHEMGHYLGLHHTFKNGCTNTDCLIDGDKVCDTPPDGTTAWIPCASTSNSCTTDADDVSTNNPFRPIGNGGLGDQLDQKENYMDYSRFECYDRFTQGQKTRMDFFLTGIRASLLSSNGCLSPCLTPINIGFTASATTVPVGSSVNFTNTTTTATSYNWFNNGVSFSTTTNASFLFNTPGAYVITLEAQNGDPNCTRRDSIVIQVTCTAQANITATTTIAPQNSVIGFQSLYTAAGTNYQWYVGGIPAGNAANLSHLFLTPGVIPIDLVVFNSTCSDTASIDVTITSLNPNVYTQVGTAVPINQNTNGSCGNTDNCFRLTPDIATPQAGGVWNLMPISLYNSFDFTFCTYLGDSDAGADGICFVLQNTGVAVIGQSGGYLGYNGISPSVGIELDNFFNGANIFGDAINADHLAINYNGLSAPSIAGPVTSLASGGNIEDNNTHVLRIVWDAICQQFDIYVDGSLRLSHTDDIVSNVFNGQDVVFWGMTGATWSNSNLQEFCVEELIFTPTSIYTNDTCITDTVVLNATTAGATSYLWQDGSTNPTHVATAVGTYWVEITTLNCIIRDTMLLQSCIPCNDSTLLELGQDRTICENGILYLNAGTGFDAYLWQDNSTDSTYTATESGLYWVEVLTICGDTLRDSLTVTIDSLGLVTITDTLICLYDTITYNLDPSYTYQWLPNQFVTCNNCPNPSFYPNTTTQYTVVSANSSGCVSVDSFTIVIDTCLLVTNLSASACLGNYYSYNGTLIAPNSIDTFVYTSSSGTDSLVILQVSALDTFNIALDTTIQATTSYNGQFYTNDTALLYNQQTVDGCDSIVLINIHIISNNSGQFLGIPDAFSPNGDGVNDDFKPIGLDESEIIEFKVFNRWSQMIYDDPEINNGGWDGTFKGVAQPQEVYIYLLRYQISGQNEVMLKGQVRLLR